MTSRIYPERRTVRVDRSYPRLSPRTDLLTRDEEQALATSIQAGRARQATMVRAHQSKAAIAADPVILAGREAAETMAERNIALAYRLAGEAASRWSVDVDDVFDVALEKLYLAIRSYRPGVGGGRDGEPIKFSTYATCSIRRGIIAAIHGIRNPIYLPNYLLDAMYRKKPGPAPDMTTPRALANLAAAGSVARMSRTYVEGMDHADAGLADLPDPRSTEGDVDAVERLEALRAAVESLEARERSVILRRFLSGRPETLKAIGRDFGVTRERIRQIEAKAVRNLLCMLAPERAHLVADRRFLKTLMAV